MTDDEREALIREIVARPYRKVITGDDIEGYLAEAPELPGCVTAGETVEDAVDAAGRHGGMDRVCAARR